MNRNHLFVCFILFFIHCFIFGQTNLEKAPKENFINLAESCKESGITFYWDTLSKNGLLEKNGHFISFTLGDASLLFDYDKISFSDAPFLSGNKLEVTNKFINDIDLLFKTPKSVGSYKVGAILIDPGHGGKDPGAIGTYISDGKKITVREKDIVLKVGLMLYKQLKKAYPDKKILITRTDDHFLELEERTDIANSVKINDHEAILYVSIHANASLDKNASGYEVWYLTPNYRRNVIGSSSEENKEIVPILNSMMEEEFTTESMLIAKFIMDSLKVQIGDKSKARGIKAEDWFVVRNAKMPSVLVEMGFVTNQKEAALLNDNTYLKKISLGLYNGISAFVEHFERSRGFTGK